MDRLREAIELLSKLLYENASLKVKAEVFRAAKFNNVEAVEPLWKLLFKLLSFCEFGKVDDITERACHELQPEELAVYVKREFQRHGYHSADFANLPVDMSGGSRELLLAFAWLLHTEQVIYRFSVNCTTLFDDDTASLYDEQSVCSSSAYGAKLAVPLVKSDGSIWERVEQLLVFNNRLRMSLRSLYSAQSECNSLKHKIHEATVGVKCVNPSADHLSMFEVYMLRHPDVLKKNVELLDKDSERLSHLLRWRELEGIFWKWMESVIDAKQLSAVDVGGAGDSGGDNMLAVYSASRLTESHHSLQQAILKYESIVEHLERACEEKIESVSSEDIDSLVQSINVELSQQRASLAHSHGAPVPATHQVEPRFLLTTKPRRQPPRNIPGLDATASSSSVSSVDRDIDEEIASLQLVINDLETEIVSMQRHFDDQLSSAGDRLHNAVCIPPLDYDFAQRFTH